ncbi:MAG TPA: VIT domain-containing protein [Vicinamibacteria bacterium]|nr:VIT domain-containing protein [Vicinamibacteria bacterium]
MKLLRYGMLVLLVVGLAATLRVAPAPVEARAAVAVAAEDEVTQGALRATSGGQIVECPLRHTDVDARVSGFIARVRVRQTFENPYDEPIEAVYVFPLPHTAAVDDMTMVIGERRVVGAIRRRAEARLAYEAALARGQTAGLLEQERPNTFTQSVANIPPRQQVTIEISYVDVLPYDRGAYAFHFPMVVGPRYIPGAPRVPDASRITPPVMRPEYRNGHDVALRVAIEAGVPIQDLLVASHQATIERASPSRATAVLSPADTIPNKDFVLTYKVTGARPETAVVAHAVPGEDGYFLLMMQPREMEEALRAAPPRDLCFLVDVSGSMSGAPTAKVIEAMRRFLDLARPEDRLQVITFASAADRLFDSYVPATSANVARALRFTDGLRGGGGTEMLKGIQMVLEDPVEPRRVRIVVMLTDGYIGNEGEIIGEVGRRAGDQVRFWTVGIGPSPNRYLLDGVARQGGGMSAVLGLNDDPSELVANAMERIHRAQLSRIDLDFGALDVSETYPARVPELWWGRPVVVLGRYRGSGPTTVRISGVAEGEPASFALEVSLPDREVAHDVLASVWARRKIEDLSDQMAVALGETGPLEDEITDLALRYRLMSAYTSFVAIDEAQGPIADEPRPPRRMLVPLPLPEGLSFEGIFGEARFESPMETITVAADAAAVGKSASRAARRKAQVSAPLAPPPPPTLQIGVEGGVAGGVPGGVVGGVVGGLPAAASVAPPATPAPALPIQPKAVFLAAGRLAQAPRADPQGQAAAHGVEARAALARARERIGMKDWEPARRQLQLAWLLEDARLAAQPWADDRSRAAIAEEWERVQEAVNETAATALPALRQRLDLVIRNASLEEAASAIAAGAGVAVRIDPGSREDAAALLGRPRRVAWLDLRRASAGRAFTWLTQPLGLEWSVEAGAVVLRSARRAPGLAPWTYEIGDIAQPLPAEYASDGSRAGAVTEEALRALESAIRPAVLRGAPPAATVTLLGPERLLVMGDADTHARAAQLLSRLRAGAAVEVDPALRARIAARAAGNAKRFSEASRERTLARGAAALHESSWALLAAASQGRTDDGAISEMLEVLSDPALVTALGTRSPALVLRSLWVIARARPAVPGDAALETLAAAAARAAGQTVVSIPLRFRETPSDANLYLAALYLALLQRMPSSVLPAGTIPASPAVADLVLRGPRTEQGTLAAAVLAGDSRAASTILKSETLRGDDAIVLAALAWKAAGRREWNAFREERPALAARAGLTAGALRVLNGLDRRP